MDGSHHDDTSLLSVKHSPPMRQRAFSLGISQPFWAMKHGNVVSLPIRSSITIPLSSARTYTTSVCSWAVTQYATDQSLPTNPSTSFFLHAMTEPQWCLANKETLDSAVRPFDSSQLNYSEKWFTTNCVSRFQRFAFLPIPTVPCPRHIPERFMYRENSTRQP